MSATLHISCCELMLQPARSRLDDSELVREAQHGKVAAFEELVHRYDQALLRFALRLTGSKEDAQDIYQEAFLKAFRNIRKFRSESSFYTWLHRIASNLCMDRLRSQRSRKEEDHVAVDSDGASYDLLEQVADPRTHGSPERALLQQELHKHIERALRKLSPRERMVFELKHYEGLRLRAVGEILNTTEETAKNILFRATHKLRAHLAYLYAL